MSSNCPSGDGRGSSIGDRPFWRVWLQDATRETTYLESPILRNTHIMGVSFFGGTTFRVGKGHRQENRSHFGVVPYFETNPYRTPHRPVFLLFLRVPGLPSCCFLPDTLPQSSHSFWEKKEQQLAIQAAARPFLGVVWLDAKRTPTLNFGRFPSPPLPASEAGGSPRHVPGLRGVLPAGRAQALRRSGSRGSAPDKRPRRLVPVCLEELPPPPPSKCSDWKIPKKAPRGLPSDTMLFWNLHHSN